MPELPPRFQSVRELNHARGSWLFRARYAPEPSDPACSPKGRPPEEVVVRVSEQKGNAEALAELAVLAAVEHSGLARLIEHGCLPTGELFVVRAWIPGKTLEELRSEKDERELARWVARICPALAHLHDRGFVHADLKGENILITEDGSPIVTDYGLSRRDGVREEVGVSGSWFAIAPEVLLGAAPDARADLFAIGVLLHSIFTTQPISPQEFYARFPAEPFLSAVGTREDELPEWARDIVCQLLERDPDKRGASALEVGYTLASRLGLDLDADRGAVYEQGKSARVRGLTLPLLTSRARWVDQQLEPGSQPSAGVRWCVVLPNEDPDALGQAIHLEAALSNRPLRLISLDQSLRELAGSVQLDQYCLELLDEARESHLLLTLTDSDPLVARGAIAVVRAAAGMDCAPQLTLLSKLAPPEGYEVASFELPPILAEDAAQFLGDRLPGARPQEVASFATLLVDLARGSASRANELLELSCESGLVLRGPNGLRLRTNAEESLGSLDVESESSPIASADELGASAVCVLAVLQLRREAATLPELGLETRLSAESLVSAASVLLTAGLVRLSGELGPNRLTLTARGRAVRPVGVETSDLHEREAARLEAKGAPRLRVLAHRWLAGESGVEAELSLEARKQRERGAAEIALQVLTEVSAQRATGLLLASEEALAWATLGEPDRAASIARELEGRVSGERDLAVVERLRAELARLRQKFSESLEHYERARQLDSDDGGRTAGGKASLLYAAEREAELDQLMDEIRSGNWGVLEDRYLRNVSMLHAMSLFRRGKVERARTLLEQFLKEARGAGDPNYEAVVSTNLGTILRRTGNVSGAIQSFKRAAELYEEAGALSGLSQARALLGGALREAGRLNEAEPHLRAALGIRDRLGDRGGAALVRGVLGLLAADRGEVRMSIEELNTSAATLDALDRSSDSLVLRARADELQARIGSQCEWRDSAASKGSPEAFDGDPRVLISHARASWIQGELSASRMYLRCAMGLAVDLGRTSVVEEAQLLIHVQRYCESVAKQLDATEERTSPFVGQDEQCASLLASEQEAFNASRAHSLALELLHCGRLDRAARMFIALSARSSDGELRQTSAEEGARLLAELSRGLTEQEAIALRRNLLGIPDPWPADLDQLGAEDEMRLDLDLSLFLEISNRMVAQQDLKALLGTIVECALKMTGGTRGFLVLEENDELSFDTAFDSRRGDINEPEVEISDSVIQRALEVMRPLRLSNAVEDPQLGGAPSITDMELRSILCCPFRIDERTRGVIYVDHRLRTDVFGPRAEMLLQHLGGQAALAIRQVRRLGEIKELNERLTKKIALTETQLDAARITLREVGAVEPTAGMVGNSIAMRNVQKILKQAAQSDLAVLVMGASGTGKELAARALHELSPWKDGPFISENCAAIPESLIEAELFGYKKGAFTGADRDRAGMFERANGGTIFLDEIGELPLELQSKLLRVLESGEIRMLGDSVVKHTKFRLVTATNRKLSECVNEGLFRADLMYRLDALRVEMPALSDRVDDIPLLADHFLRVQNAVDGVERKISRAMVKALCMRPWPGNVRELSNEISRLCVLSDGDLVDTELLRAPHGEQRLPSTRVLSLDQVERQAIENALVTTGGDKRKAAELLGISQSKIYQRLAAWKQS